ncbi:uncharacterized protein LODBEIA_P22110 [Lodderomyces beijingensis]|uniref:M-phase inducer phosphatase n=1 Tax=Lodderomyces beijingensis TaxID=1775926 RepID=A0ABP0ZKS9_9ASCO
MDSSKKQFAMAGPKGDGKRLSPATINSNLLSLQAQSDATSPIRRYKRDRPLSSCSFEFLQEEQENYGAEPPSSPASPTPIATPNKSSSRQRLFSQKKPSLASLTISSSSSNSNSSLHSRSPPQFPRAPLKTLSHSVKQKTIAFTRAMTDVVSKSSASSSNFFGSQSTSTPRVDSSYFSSLDRPRLSGEQEQEQEQGEVDLGNGVETDHDEDDDEDDEGDDTFDTINVVSPIRQNQALRNISKSPVNTNRVAIRRFHSVCQTQQEIESFKLMQDNSHLKHTTIKTYSSTSDAIPRINEDQMYQILDGNHNCEFDEFMIVDCRFDYEFDGGHIVNAVNISTKETLEEIFFNKVDEDASNGQSKKNTKKLVIFHCEYSLFRGPSLAKQLRKLDRTKNHRSYPFLSHPDIVILDGGYKQFYTKYDAEFCTPQNYVPMRQANNEDKCKVLLNQARKENKILQRSNSMSSSQVSTSSTPSFYSFPSSASASASASSLQDRPMDLFSTSTSTSKSSKILKRQKSNSKVANPTSPSPFFLSRSSSSITTTSFEPPRLSLKHTRTNSFSSVHSNSSSSCLSSPLISNFPTPTEEEFPPTTRLQPPHAAFSRSLSQASSIFSSSHRKSISSTMSSSSTISLLSATSSTDSLASADAAPSAITSSSADYNADSLINHSLSDFFDNKPTSILRPVRRKPVSALPASPVTSNPFTLSPSTTTTTTTNSNTSYVFPVKRSNAPQLNPTSGNFCSPAVSSPLTLGASHLEDDGGAGAGKMNHRRTATSYVSYNELHEVDEEE